LLNQADVLIHNLRPGEVTKLGIDATTLRLRYPRLVYCEISAFGHKGPRKLQPGYEPLLQAFGGLMSMNGHAEDAPSRMGASIVDQGAAMWAVIGILAALNHRQATGVGSVVNTSLLETAIGWGAPRVHEFLNQGRTSERYGTGHPNLVPYQAFDAADGQMMICAGNDRLFAKLAHALEQPHWAVDERFARNRDRLRNRELLVQLIQDLVRGRSRGGLIEELERAGVPVAAVNTIAETVAEPQVIAIDIIRPVADEGFELAGLPVSFDGIRPVVSRTAPSLGEANDQYIAGAMT
jgi:formyl-CoA transferase